MKLSRDGYKRNSKDVNNPYNVIPSGNITMKGVDFPVMGTDNLGNQQLMQPGFDYEFPGDMVFEEPAQDKSKNVVKQRKVDRDNKLLPNYTKEMGDVSSHIMTTMQFTDDGGKPIYIVIPMLYPLIEGQETSDPTSWIEFPKGNEMQAFEFAEQRGEIYYFDSEAKADEFAKGSWKTLKKRDGGSLPKAQFRGINQFIKSPSRFFKSRSIGKGLTDAPLTLPLDYNTPPASNIINHTNSLPANGFGNINQKALSNWDAAVLDHNFSKQADNFKLDIPLTRVLSSKGLKIEDGILYSKTEPHKYAKRRGENNAFTLNRNTTHWSYGHIGDPGHASWSSKSTAIINDFDNLKKSGLALNFDPTDTYFYTKGDFEIPSNSLILTRDKKLYNKIKKESNITNIKLFENTTNDEFEAIVNSYSTKGGKGKIGQATEEMINPIDEFHGGGGGEGEMIFRDHLIKNYEAGQDVAFGNKANSGQMYTPSWQGHDFKFTNPLTGRKSGITAMHPDFDFSWRKLNDVYGAGQSRVHSGDPLSIIEGIEGIPWEGNHGISMWDKYGGSTLDDLFKYPKTIQVNEADKMLRLMKNKPDALKFTKELAEMNGFKSYKEFKKSVDITNFKKDGGSLPKAQDGGGSLPSFHDTGEVHEHEEGYEPWNKDNETSEEYNARIRENYKIKKKEHEAQMILYNKELEQYNIDKANYPGLLDQYNIDLNTYNNHEAAYNTQLKINELQLAQVERNKIYHKDSPLYLEALRPPLLYSYGKNNPGITTDPNGFPIREVLRNDYLNARAMGSSGEQGVNINPEFFHPDEYSDDHDKEVYQTYMVPYDRALPYQEYLKNNKRYISEINKDPEGTIYYQTDYRISSDDEIKNDAYRTFHFDHNTDELNTLDKVSLLIKQNKELGIYPDAWSRENELTPGLSDYETDPWDTAYISNYEKNQNPQYIEDFTNALRRPEPTLPFDPINPIQPILEKFPYNSLVHKDPNIFQKIKKNINLGDWAIGSGNSDGSAGTSFNPKLYNHYRNQRKAFSKGNPFDFINPAVIGAYPSNQNGRRGRFLGLFDKGGSLPKAQWQLIDDIGKYALTRPFNKSTWKSASNISPQTSLVNELNLNKLNFTGAKNFDVNALIQNNNVNNQLLNDVLQGHGGLNTNIDYQNKIEEFAKYNPNAKILINSGSGITDPYLQSIHDRNKNIFLSNTSRRDASGKLIFNDEIHDLNRLMSSEMGKNLNKYAESGLYINNYTDDAGGVFDYSMNKGLMTDDRGISVVDPINNMARWRGNWNRGVNQHNHLLGTTNRYPSTIISGDRGFVTDGTKRGLNSWVWNTPDGAGTAGSQKVANFLDQSFQLDKPIDGTFMKIQHKEEGGSLPKAQWWNPRNTYQAFRNIFKPKLNQNIGNKINFEKGSGFTPVSTRTPSANKTYKTFKEWDRYISANQPINPTYQFPTLVNDAAFNNLINNKNLINVNSLNQYLDKTKGLNSMQLYDRQRIKTVFDDLNLSDQKYIYKDLFLGEVNKTLNPQLTIPSLTSLPMKTGTSYSDYWMGADSPFTPVQKPFEFELNDPNYKPVYPNTDPHVLQTFIPNSPGVPMYDRSVGSSHFNPMVNDSYEGGLTLGHNRISFDPAFPKTTISMERQSDYAQRYNVKNSSGVGSFDEYMNALKDTKPLQTELAIEKSKTKLDKTTKLIEQINKNDDQIIRKILHKEGGLEHFDRDLHEVVKHFMNFIKETNFNKDNIYYGLQPQFDTTYLNFDDLTHDQMIEVINLPQFKNYIIFNNKYFKSEYDENIIKHKEQVAKNEKEIYDVENWSPLKTNLERYKKNAPTILLNELIDYSTKIGNTHVHIPLAETVAKTQGYDANKWGAPNPLFHEFKWTGHDWNTFNKTIKDASIEATANEKLFNIGPFNFDARGIIIKEGKLPKKKSGKMFVNYTNPNTGKVTSIKGANTQEVLNKIETIRNEFLTSKGYNPEVDYKSALGSYKPEHQTILNKSTETQLKKDIEQIFGKGYPYEIITDGRGNPYIRLDHTGTRLPIKNIHTYKSGGELPKAQVPKLVYGTLKLANPSVRNVNIINKTNPLTVLNSNKVLMNINNRADLIEQYNLRNNMYRTVNIDDKVLNNQNLIEGAKLAGFNPKANDQLAAFMATTFTDGSGRRAGFTNELEKGGNKGILYTGDYPHILNRRYTTGQPYNSWTIKSKLFEDDVKLLSDQEIYNRISLVDTQQSHEPYKGIFNVGSISSNQQLNNLNVPHGSILNTKTIHIPELMQTNQIYGELFKPVRTPISLFRGDDLNHLLKINPDRFIQFKNGGSINNLTSRLIKKYEEGGTLTSAGHKHLKSLGMI